VFPFPSVSFTMSEWRRGSFAYS